MNTAEKRSESLRSRFANPVYVLNSMKEFFEDGDYESITDLILSYVKNSPKYKSQEDFAKAIGTSRSTLSRMYAHDNVSLSVFFDALGRIREDAQEQL